MKNLALILACSFLLSMPALAEDTAENQTNMSAEDYDKQFEENMKEATAQLQAVTKELVQYMNTLNKALDTAMPQMTDSMGQVISSMKPVAATMQKNMDEFVKELNQQLDIPEESEETSSVPSPETVVIPDTDMQDLNNEIDKELAEINPFVPELPQKKIKLFPYTVE